MLDLLVFRLQPPFYDAYQIAISQFDSFTRVVITNECGLFNNAPRTIASTLLHEFWNGFDKKPCPPFVLFIV